jgi:drug/metabolite transporter (DMT)-like permease
MTILCRDLHDHGACTGMFRNIAFVCLGAVSFGLLSTFVKLGYGEGFTAPEISGVQVLFGMTLLWALTILRSITRKLQGRPPKITSKKTAPWKLLLAGTSFGLSTLLYNKAIELLPASMAAVLLMTYVWMSILMEIIVWRRKPQRAQVISATLIVGGALPAAGLISNGWDSISWLGVFYNLGAAICYAVFIDASGHLGNEMSVYKKSAWMITGAAIVVILVSPPGFFFDGSMQGELLQWGFLLALLGTVVPTVFLSTGLPKIGVSLGSILTALELPVAIIAAMIVLHEPVSTIQWLGVSIMLAALILPVFKKVDA